MFCSRWFKLMFAFVTFLLISAPAHAENDNGPVAEPYIGTLGFTAIDIFTGNETDMGDYYNGGTMCGFSEGSGLDFGPCGPGETCTPFDIGGGIMGGVCTPCSGGSCNCQSTQFACGTSCCESGATCFNGTCSGGSSSSSSSTSSTSSSSSSSQSSSSSPSSSSSSSVSSSSSESSSSSSNTSSSSSSSDASSESSSSSNDSSSSEDSSSSSTQSSSSSSSSISSQGSSSSASSSDSSSSSNPLPPGCEEKVIVEEKAYLELGPKLLIKYADKNLKRLVKATSGAYLKKKLRGTGKQAKKKLEFWIKEAEVTLSHLPEVMVVCSSQEICPVVDNSEVINRHIHALLKLRNKVTHVLNRSTRLVFSDPTEARRITQKFGKKIRRYGKELVHQAESLPKVQSLCE